jgi:methylthioribose-1-phosphate isomerase
MRESPATKAVMLDDDSGVLDILDQSLLPNKVLRLRLSSVEAIREAISELKVRGAPAIGIAAAYASYLALRSSTARDWPSLAAEFRAAAARLASARPTAANLGWALARMEARLEAMMDRPLPEVKAALKDEAIAIDREDEANCRAMGEHALALLGKGWGLLTHCNAGSLATSGYGTATAAIYLGTERGYDFRVFADETRPLLQGARLTAWELMAAGVNVTLICDNMASSVMARGWVQAVLVGCDRVAANGDSANKIGTSGLAILARHYGIPFHVHAPLSTLDLSCATGKDIPIEERPAGEVTESWYARRMAPEGVAVFNPAFDVTEAGLITAIITEKGVALPPFGESLARLAGASRAPCRGRRGPLDPGLPA